MTLNITMIKGHGFKSGKFLIFQIKRNLEQEINLKWNHPEWSIVFVCYTAGTYYNIMLMIYVVNGLTKLFYK